MSENKLKESIDAVVRANGTKEISGTALNGVLKEIVDGGKELGRESYFYPSVIKEACINNEDILLYDNYPIAIASINFSTHIVTINKKIILPPDVTGNAFATKWQMYLVGVSALDANNILQLTGQTGVSTFTFEVVSGQTSATLQARFITIFLFDHKQKQYLNLLRKSAGSAGNKKKSPAHVADLRREIHT